jgi:hypothetical protein
MRAMNTAPEWYHDHTVLLSRLKESGWPFKSVPTILGYENVEELRRGGQDIDRTPIQPLTRRPGRTRL